MKKIFFTITLLLSVSVNAGQLGGDPATWTPQQKQQNIGGNPKTWAPQDSKNLGGDPATWTPQQKQQPIGGNPSTWTPLPDITTFKGASPYAAMSIVTNNIKLGEGFEVIPANPSTGYRMEVKVTPLDAFSIIEVPASKGGMPGNSASMAKKRYVANQPGTVNVTVKTMAPGQTQGNVMQYLFDISK